MGNDLFLKYNITSNKPIELLYIKEVGNADFLTLNSIKKIGIKFSNPKLYKLHLPYYFVNKTDSLYKDIEKDCRRFIQ